MSPDTEGEPGARGAHGSGPREGIYLDAALAVVEQQVNERIDGAVARKRTATRGLMVGLLVTTLAGGAATAAALTITPGPTTPTVMVESSVELHCVDGASTAAPAVFTARFSVRTEESSRIDLAGICAAARAAVVADRSDPAAVVGPADTDASLQNASPDELLAVATDLVTTSTSPSSMSPSSMSQTSRHTVDVVEASFGSAPLSAAAPSYFTACERARDGRVVVLMTALGDEPITAANTMANTAAAQTDRCLANSGYRLYEEKQ